MEFTNLFADSSTSGRLVNFSLTDFGSQFQKARLSFGNVPLGIYRLGSRKKPRPLFHDETAEKEVYQLAAQLKFRSHYYASLRNFKDGVLMNFTDQDFQKGLYFSTWTFNNFQTNLKFSFAKWTTKNCVFPTCQKPHLYQTVSTETSSFLAEKRIAKRQLERTSEGVNDLFASAILQIQKLWKPTNFKWVAVPELHKCQTACHWKGQKSKKKGWKNHAESNCYCQTKHTCLRNWHIHMLSTDFLPEKYQHARCGLGKFSDQGSPLGCWDHRGYIAHEIWPHGLVDIKRVSHLKVQGKPIQSAERAVLYLIKYLAKSFEMRQDKEFSQKVGLLKGMGIYKFFRCVFGYQENGLSYIQEKRKKPVRSSSVFINEDYGFQLETEKEFSPYFEKGQLKKQARQICRSTFTPPKLVWTIPEFLKTCLYHASRSKVKKNEFWKPCDTSDESVWQGKGKGWSEIRCPIRADHHAEMLVRWEFEFQGKESYQAFINKIKPALAQLRMPLFKKFSEYHLTESEYNKFAQQTKLPWNKEIAKYEPIEEADELWKETVPPHLVYNHVYLKEIRRQISGSGWKGLDPNEAVKRYADY